MRYSIFAITIFMFLCFLLCISSPNFLKKHEISWVEIQDLFLIEHYFFSSKSFGPPKFWIFHKNLWALRILLQMSSGNIWALSSGEPCYFAPVISQRYIGISLKTFRVTFPFSIPVSISPLYLDTLLKLLCFAHS